MDDRIEILGDTQGSEFKPTELFSVEQQKSRLILANENLLQDTKTMMEESVHWLPAFAEQYNISPSLKDYILVPCCIMSSDLPNRNAQAFPYEELVRADPETGLMGFETWARKPTHIDHINKDYTKAKGVIFSSYLKPMNCVGNIHKVMTLLGFDRSRDPILANSILNGERPSYSMGAWSRGFTCSLCNAQHTSQHAGCEHINAKMPRLGVTTDNKMIYLKAHHIGGFEVSNVGSPAFFSATTPPSMHLNPSA